MNKLRTVEGVLLECLGHNTYRVAGTEVLVMLHGTGRAGEPGHRYTYLRYGYSGCESTYRSLASACKAYLRGKS